MIIDQFNSTTEVDHEKNLQCTQKEKPLSPELHPVIQEFQQLIETNVELFIGFQQMFEQVPATPPYDADPSGKPQVLDYITMLKLFDRIIREAPAFDDNLFVGFPINTILCWPMGTQAGFNAFMNPKVNAMFHKMFNVWSTYLSTPASCSVLDNSSHGWFGPAATAKMPDFAATYICDPLQPYHGFKSWDDFFTRRFRPGARPVEHPDDDTIISNACESTVYRVAYEIKLRDTFWLKQQPYSLLHMLDNDPLAHHFVGGCIRQAFLSALNYHRWASPVNGRIIKTVGIPGTYYAVSPSECFSSGQGADPVAACASQSFLTSVAARVAIYIESDNSSIGLMCFLAVGMAEVSTCEVTVSPGDVVRKGDELGMFHFGGSTYCLIFRSEAKVKFFAAGPEDTAVNLNAAIGKVLN